VPEEFLRTLVEAEISARDLSSVRTRRQARLSRPPRRLAEFGVAAFSIQPTTFDSAAPTRYYLSSPEWIRVAENAALIGPAGTGKSDSLIALGSQRSGHRVRYFTGADTR
jgi:DNA replication protein DnaC